MQEFKIWFEIGFDHIINYQALDHILFIVALTVIYDIKMIKKILKTKIDNNDKNLEEPIERISKISRPINGLKISLKRPRVI